MPRPKLVDGNGRFLVPVVIDTREQKPFDFEGLSCDQQDGGGPLTVPTVRGTLASGDYSLVGFEDRVAVERKSLQDLFGTIGQGRDRFERELDRLAKYEFAAVVIEADWRAILGIYPPELLALKQVFSDRLRDRDASAPWAQWLFYLNSAMPGPPEHSQLTPKTCYRSVNAWDVRYPRIKWRECFDRRFAEVTTFRLLERFLKEHLNRGEIQDTRVAG